MVTNEANNPNLFVFASCLSSIFTRCGTFALKAIPVGYFQDTFAAAEKTKCTFLRTYEKSRANNKFSLEAMASTHGTVHVRILYLLEEQ